MVGILGFDGIDFAVFAYAFTQKIDSLLKTFTSKFSLLQPKNSIDFETYVVE